MDNCSKLASRFSAAAKNEGLADVKFFLRNLDEAVKEQVCREVEDIYEALDNKSVVDSKFRDSYQTLDVS